jgi:ERCC4-type nuclease
VTLRPLYQLPEKEQAEARERRLQAFAEYQFPGPAIVPWLLLNYFDGPDHVMETPDRELMALPGVGQKNLATLRSVFPNRHPHPPDCPKAGKWVYCPYCGTPL